MSQTVSGIDAKAHLIDRLQTTCKMYLGDLAHLPEDKLGASPMGKARSPQAFTAECAGFNHMMAGLLQGEPTAMPSEEERAAFTAGFSSMAACREQLEASVQHLIAAVEGLSNEQLAEATTAPWGSPMDKFSLAEICATHMNYHDGQINYIQALYGDDQDHWGM